MKIIFYQRDFPAESDYGRDYAEIISALASRGHQIVVLTPHPGVSETEWHGVTIVRCPVGIGMLFATKSILRELLSKQKYDVIFVHEWWNLGAHSLAKEGRNLKFPVMFAPWASLNPFALSRNWLGGVKRLVCRMIGYWYGKNPPVLNVYDVCDAGFAKQVGIWWPFKLGSLPVYKYDTHQDIFDWKRVLKRDISGFRILCFNARLDIWQKGFDILLEGFKLALQQRGKLFRTLLVLSGRAPDGRLAHDGVLAEHMACALEKTGFAIWLGEVSNEDRANMLAHCDMFVYPSRVDGPPRPLREALWRQTPIMVTYETGMASWVNSYRAGIVITAPTALAVRDAVVVFDKMSDEEIKIMRAQAEMLAERLTPPCLALDYERALQEILCK